MSDNAPERIWVDYSDHSENYGEAYSYDLFGNTEYLRADVAHARIEALSGLILDLAELVEDCLEDGGEFSTEWDIKARDSLARAKELSI